MAFLRSRIPRFTPTSKLYVKVAGIQKQGIYVFVKIAGVWKAARIYNKVSGSWKV